MTLIVGIEQAGVVYMAADTGGWRDGFEDSTAASKLFTLGPLLIAYCADLRAANIVRYRMEDLPSVEGDPEAYMVREFIPRLQSALDANWGFKKGDEEAQLWGGSMLVGCGGHVFQVSGAFDVWRNDRGYAVFGGTSAMGVALGVLAVTQGVPTSARLTLALEVAADHTDYVRAPFHFASSSADLFLEGAT